MRRELECKPLELEKNPEFGKLDLIDPPRGLLPPMTDFELLPIPDTRLDRSGLPE